MTTCLPGIESGSNAPFTPASSWPASPTQRTLERCGGRPHFRPIARLIKPLLERYSTSNACPRRPPMRHPVNRGTPNQNRPPRSFGRQPLAPGIPQILPQNIPSKHKQYQHRSTDLAPRDPTPAKRRSAPIQHPCVPVLDVTNGRLATHPSSIHGNKNDPATCPPTQKPPGNPTISPTTTLNPNRFKTTTQSFGRKAKGVSIKWLA